MQTFTTQSLKRTIVRMPHILMPCLLCFAAMVVNPGVNSTSASPPTNDPIEAEITRLSAKLSSYLRDNFDSALASVDIKSPQGSSTVAKGLTSALRQQLSRQDIESAGGSKAIAGEVKFARTASGSCLMMLTLNVMHQDKSTLISLRGRRIELDDFDSLNSFAERQLRKNPLNETRTAIAQR